MYSLGYNSDSLAKIIEAANKPIQTPEQTLEGYTVLEAVKEVASKDKNSVVDYKAEKVGENTTLVVNQKTGQKSEVESLGFDSNYQQKTKIVRQRPPTVGEFLSLHRKKLAYAALIIAGLGMAYWLYKKV